MRNSGTKYKKMKKPYLILMIITVFVLLGGCKGREPRSADVIMDMTVGGIITDETSTLGIDSTDKDFEKNLTNNTYYVVHDGIYYPLYAYYENEAYKDDSSSELYAVNSSRMMFYTLENEINIPTLFPGDQLIFYSTDTMLDVLSWERYYDIGITFGIYNLHRTVGGKYYLDLNNDKDNCIIPDSELASILDLGVPQVLVDRIGGAEIKDNLIDNGIILGAVKNEIYDMEIYTGTIYQHYNAYANVHAFRGYELYGSLSFKTLRDNFWEIEIPEYFVNGYYNINDGGLFRLCKDNSYSEMTQFNDPVLYPMLDGIYLLEDGEYRIYSTDETYTMEDYLFVTSLDTYSPAPPKRYSANEEINNFSTNIIGCTGFVDNSMDDFYMEIAQTAEKEETDRLHRANVLQYELWFPEGRTCRISIKSDETTGSATVRFANGSANTLTYNEFDDTYEASFTGTGIYGTITIGGFTQAYDIELTNIELYNGQDSVSANAVSDNGTEEDGR